MLNVLLLCKYEYFNENGKVRDELTVGLVLVIYLMIILLVMRFLCEIKEAVTCRCEKLTASVQPENGEKAKKKKKKSKGKIEKEKESKSKKYEKAKS